MNVKGLTGKLLLAAASLVFWFGLIEAGLRLAGYQPEKPTGTLLAWQKKGLFMLAPNSVGKTRRGGHPIRANSLGMRDREVSRKSPTSQRILFLGDSVTFGHALPIEAAFVRRLEVLYAKQDREVQVVNGAIYGWSTRQEYLFYEKHGLGLDPDLVLVGFVLNDVKELKQFVESSLDAESIAAVNAMSWLAEKTATVAAAKRVYVAVFAPHRRETTAVEDLVNRPDAPEIRHAMGLVKQELTRIAELAAERGHRFGLVLFPFSFQFEGEGRDRPQKELTEFARSKGIPVLDTLPTLKKYPPMHVLLDQDHFSAEGHQIVAGLIADWINSEGLLASKP